VSISTSTRRPAKASKSWGLNSSPINTRSATPFLAASSAQAARASGLMS